jgi:preprotein translocase subunit Sec63
MNRDIEGLHARLLSLSASKMVEIEKVLTKEQLKDLRAQRQNAPEAKLVSNRN